MHKIYVKAAYSVLSLQFTRNWIRGYIYIRFRSEFHSYFIFHFSRHLSQINHVWSMFLNVKPGPKFWNQNKSTIANAVNAINPKVNILSGNGATLSSPWVVPYFWMFLAIKSRCRTNSNSSSMVVVDPPRVTLEFPSFWN